MGYEWDFGAVLRQSDLLIAGGIGTLKLAGAALLFGVPAGLLLALLRLSGKPVLSWPALAMIEFFRSSSVFVLLFWFFYAFPILIGLDLDAFVAGTLAIGLHSAALFAELFRAGITGLPRGQREAAKALGLSAAATYLDILLPQALRAILPVFFTQAIELVKATSLASAIAFAELSYSAARIAAQSYRPLETFITVGAIYFMAIFLASQAVRLLEHRLGAAYR